MKSLALISTLLSVALATPLVYPRAQQCNGDPELCHRQYSNITFIGAHDSPFVGSITELAANQGLSVVDQLNHGIRFLTAQAHKNAAGDLHFCHSYCWEYDAGSVDQYLSTVKKWMDSNPDEVLTLLLVNGGNYDVSLYNTAFQSSNLAKYAYRPTKNPLKMHEWPTLGSMISANNRLVVLMDYGADVSRVPYILPEFDMYFETPFDVTNAAFPSCSINRPPGAKPDGRMYGMNHFLDTDVLGSGIKVPNNGMDFKTNAARGKGSIGAQAAVCAGKYGRYPNFVLVDRFQRGEVFQAQKAMNFPERS